MFQCKEHLPTLLSVNTLYQMFVPITRSQFVSFIKIIHQLCPPSIIVVVI